MLQYSGDLPETGRSTTATLTGGDTTGDLVEPRWYEQMLLIRTVEERLLALYAQGLLDGTVHTAIGQEACAVGVVNALDRDRDVVFSNHRGHGHFIAYSDEVEGLIAEVMGRSIGVCGGIGGTQNLHWRNLYTGGIQGGMMPVAVGAALAEKLKGSDAICAIFLGDGTMGQGTVYEGLNVASLWSLPLLFVLENNGYAQSTPTALEHAGDLSTRADTFAIEHAVADGNDVLAVHEAALAAVHAVRSRGRPYFLALNTYRIGPHSKGDDTREPAEIEAHRADDPLTRYAAGLDEQARAAIERTVLERVERAVAAAQAAPAQAYGSFMERVSWR